ncbi:MerR family transcriptional regulator [Streptomyces sp. NPDC020983]|uniref:MerR family transcriptional regulator n=1 Tax=Streptomyces sp. NPDC020983 TaxID=3365106 RepID=UPI0037A54F79
MTGTTLTPAGAADRTGVSLDTLRYYEREGLIGPIGRTTGGRRQYTEDDVFWIGLVTCFREAGLGIADVRAFVGILRAEHRPEDRVAFLRERRAGLEQRVAALRRAIGVLDDKIAYYGTAASTDSRG